MQLGTRWSVGAEPPARLSDVMKAAVAAVENERGSAQDTGGWHWTLTWLEGHPRAELDDGTIVREDHDRSIVVLTNELDS